MIPEPHFTPTVPGLIGHFAAQHGEAEALVRDGLRVTFTELDRRSAAVARALIERGAGKGARSAILAPPSPEFVIAVLAATRIGAVAVPRSTLYQARSEERREGNDCVSHGRSRWSPYP